ncbi:hypothetical protein OQH60_04215 [Campylobacter sp. MIT 21-1685]|uniref:hypothetical protein n=1 Tax=unclassified Campylobacter TaxID=2593542 RepID=UPI00224AEBA2|nr:MULTISPECIES: hypothetical protein [unclassified Campylobacter]MCX2683067.1 hypothetical protein [Campylobacter sp. MIT 21-1684]MCX2751349.1 hypothetical protein [Campylobacter sp. MIT 21-1682]MCX2807548.1 hypothetical protein [Campylobacter sp. MIT 21-1685]
MKNTLIIFENSVLNTEKKEVKTLLEDLSFNLASKQISQNPHKTQEILDTLLLNFLTILKKLELFNDENVTKIIRGLTKASVQDIQNSLYKNLNEAEILKKQIQNQKIALKNQISKHFLEFENILQKNGFIDDLKQGLNDAILFDIETLGILKETAESAFLITLEKAEDIEFTSGEIAKSLVYNAICEAHFEKERILRISNIILNTAFELANESMAYAKDLCLGAIKGTQEGISFAMEKFKNSFKYAQFEEDLHLKNKELIGIEDDFIALLKTELTKQDNPCKDIIKNLLEQEFDNLFTKFKRLANESREQLVFALNEIKQNPKISDFTLFGYKQLLHSKQEMIKEKYKDFNAQKAKKLGVRLWENAKNILKKQK